MLYKKETSTRLVNVLFKSRQSTIRGEIPLSFTMVSLLTMLPVFAMGILGIRLDKMKLNYSFSPAHFDGDRDRYYAKRQRLAGNGGYCRNRYRISGSNVAFHTP